MTPFAAFPEFCGFLCQMLQVHDHARAEDIGGLGAENAGGEQVQNEFSPVVHNRVSRIVTALIADNDIIFLAQQVDHAALALVSPVGTYDGC